MSFDEKSWGRITMFPFTHTIISLYILGSVHYANGMKRETLMTDLRQIFGYATSLCKSCHWISILFNIFLPMIRVHALECWLGVVREAIALCIAQTTKFKRQNVAIQLELHIDDIVNTYKNQIMANWFRQSQMERGCQGNIRTYHWMKAHIKTKPQYTSLFMNS